MRRLLDRLPLRAKLAVASVGLMTAALVIISVITYINLRDYLLEQTDQRLHSLLGQFAGYPPEDVVYTAQHGGVPSDVIVGSQDFHNPGLLAGYHMTKADADVLLPATLDQARAQANTVRTVHAGGRVWLVTDGVQRDGRVITVGIDLSEMNRALGRLLWIDLLVGGGVLVAIGSIAVGAVRTSLRPLVTIERTAAAIAAGDLTRRVPAGDPNTEIGRLNRSLNAMLAQIEGAFVARSASEITARASEARALASEERMRRFVADASHELRTPLTTIRGFAELYRQGAVTEPAEAARVMRRIEDEAARMGLLVEDLLLLARLDQQRPLAVAPVDLRVLTADAVHDARAVAPDRDISLLVAPDAGPLVVLGDDSRLRQVIGNLVGNALTHTPAGTPVQVRLFPADGAAVVEVADRGQGLAPDQAMRVFERFYRADSARSRRDGASGTGLGLAIVAALVAAHGGTVDVDSFPGEGATFRVRLPLSVGDQPAGEGTSGAPISNPAPGGPVPTSAGSDAPAPLDVPSDPGVEATPGHESGQTAESGKSV